MAAILALDDPAGRLVFAALGLATAGPPVRLIAPAQLARALAAEPDAWVVGEPGTRGSGARGSATGDADGGGGDDADAGGQRRRVAVDRAALLADPPAALRALCLRLGVPYDAALLEPLEAAAREERTATAGEQAARAALGSGHTEAFPALVAATGGALLVSTYQAGQLVVVRTRGEELNTHFRAVDKPMGIAVAAGRFALGTRTEVWDLRDVPAAAAQVAEPGEHDACFLLRNRHVTGDVAIHELAFAGDGELWGVATAFSCLATFGPDHSFVPRWTPPWISELAPGDRCHLNGLAMRDGAPAWVTALGTGDADGSWRAGKATGGVLVDVASSEVAIGGLCMPHSPRWDGERLWVLESGKGRLCLADLAAGTVEPVCELPGFTRGLLVTGDVAWVGLSQIRESSQFADLPLTARLADRQSGVWAVDLRHGTPIAFLRFDDLVQEVFDVALLPGTRWPEVAEPDGAQLAQTYVLG